jgi:hypothetical protein
MSKENPIYILGHKTKIYRIGKSHNPAAGPWICECECGFKKVTFGQATAAVQKKRHENQVVFGTV